jgi:tRNA(Ile)-lysidine synthase TilS/MesJ
MSKKLGRFVGKAIVEFGMIHEGDRILVAVSVRSI